MSNDSNDRSAAPEGNDAEGAARRRILIGSQKNPEAYRPKRRDWQPAAVPDEAPPAEAAAASPTPEAAAQPEETPEAPPAPAEAVVPPSEIPPPAPPVKQTYAPLIDAAAPVEPPLPAEAAGDDLDDDPAIAALASEFAESVPPTAAEIPPASFRGRLTPDLEQELEDALEGMSLDDLLSQSDAISKQDALEADSQHTGRVLTVRGDDVFVELGGREQGVVSIRQFVEPPAPGDKVGVRVVRFNREEGLYELAPTRAAAKVADWGDLAEGMIVDAQVTGHNTGGLECEVNHIRGFIPISQIALYRVENAAEFVGQKLTCLVTEASPERRNLVLSRRALLEREKEENRERLLASLAPGQVFTGVVRKLMDFGAFVDIGGIDGLLHISQLSWARVKHPSEVLQEGQSIQVRVNKVDPETGKISFGYRDMLENPWTNAATNYPSNAIVRGVVTKLMEFGAFVQLEPGVEGLVHISELSPKRIWRPSDVVQEGQDVEVMVLSVDVPNQRMSLSLKAVAILNEPKKDEKKTDEPAEAAPPPTVVRKQPTGPLKGGVGRASGGEQFGLKW